MATKDLVIETDITSRDLLAALVTVYKAKRGADGKLRVYAGQADEIESLIAEVLAFERLRSPETLASWAISEALAISDRFFSAHPLTGVPWGYVNVQAFATCELGAGEESRREWAAKWGAVRDRLDHPERYSAPQLNSDPEFDGFIVSCWGERAAGFGATVEEARANAHMRGVKGDIPPREEAQEGIVLLMKATRDLAAQCRSVGDGPLPSWEAFTDGEQRWAGSLRERGQGWMIDSRANAYARQSA